MTIKDRDNPSMHRAIRRKAVGNDVVHYALARGSSFAYCAEGDHFIKLTRNKLSLNTPVTCIACVALAEEVV